MQQAPDITKEDLVKYGTFDTVDAVPDDHKKLVLFASDLVMHLVKNNYNPQSEVHVLAVKKAICSQVSYWFESGINPVDDSDVSSYSLGELSVSLGSNSSSQGQSRNALCSMSRMYLNDAYLLYRGMRHGRI